MPASKAFVFLLLATSAILLAAMLMPSGAAEDPLPLTILHPLQWETVNDTSMTITGMTLPNATVNVTVMESYGYKRSRAYSGSADENGTFAVLVELYEDTDQIVVDVTDSMDRSVSATVDVRCDIEPPHVIVLKPPVSPFYTNGTNYTIVVQQTCDCRYWVSIGGVEVLMTGVARRTVDLVEGENRFEVKAWDNVFNTIVFWVVIFSDTTPPVLEPRWSTGEEVVTNHALLRFGGDVTGAFRIDVTLNGLVHPGVIVAGDPNASRRWYCDLDLGPVDGEWETTVRAADALGNLAEGTVRIVLDTTPPVIVLHYVNATLVPRVQINGTTEAGIDAILVDGQDYPVVDGLFSVVQPLRHGWNSVIFQAVDGAENHATAIARVFYSQRRPLLAVQAPETLGGDRVRIQGSTDRYVLNVTMGARVFPVVNGTFDVVVNLTKGENGLDVRVEDPAGSMSIARVEVREGTPGSLLPAMAVTMVLVVLLTVLVALLSRQRSRRTGSP